MRNEELKAEAQEAILKAIIAAAPKVTPTALEQLANAYEKVADQRFSSSENDGSVTVI